MPRTPDSRDGPLYEEEIRFEEQSSDPSGDGYMRYVSGAFRMQDDDGVFDPRFSDIDHKVIRHLIHLAEHGGPWDEFSTSPYREPKSGSGPWDHGYIWWESSSKSKKIVEKTINRNSNKTPSTIVWKVYDTDGSTVLVTATDTYAYTGGALTYDSITRTFS